MSPQRNTVLSSSVTKKLNSLGINRGIMFILIILTALLAFESFNFSTTNFALTDLLGNLTFASLSWATILSIAFCGIDFAGIARLFTSDRKSGETTEVWYMFGAWMLAATMNAILTWWAVSLALENHALRSTTVIDQNTLLKAVPIFVAMMVWLIRILIIGSLSMAGDRLLTHEVHRASTDYSEPVKTYTPHPAPIHSTSTARTTTPVNVSSSSFQPVQRAAVRQETATPRQVLPVRNNESLYKHAEVKHSQSESPVMRPEPVYQPVNSSSKQTNQAHLL